MIRRLPQLGNVSLVTLSRSCFPPQFHPLHPCYSFPCLTLFLVPVMLTEPLHIFFLHIIQTVLFHLPTHHSNSSDHSGLRLNSTSSRNLSLKSRLHLRSLNITDYHSIRILHVEIFHSLIGRLPILASFVKIGNMLLF